MFNHLLGNPFQQSLKKYIFDLIKDESFFAHEPSIELLCKNATSPKEYESLGRLFASVYEAGYIRAIDEHRTELNKLGLKATIKTIEKTPDAKPIFNQKNPAAGQ